MEEEQSKCYVFISHSHKDLKKVRLVRNYLENHDFEPILFYLHCMDNADGDKDKEKLRELIYREIDSREWFLYLDSFNARKSAWVKAECEYIKTRKNHVMRKLCIDFLSEDEIIESILDLMRELSIFISYSHQDAELGEMFYKEFCSCGLKVFFGRKTIDKLWTYQWVDEIGQSIEEASKKGGIVLLMTKNSLKSQNMQYELRRAISLNGRIYPIYFGEASEIDIESELNLFIGNIKWIKCQPNEQGVRDCVQRIVCDIKNRISNTP